MGQRNMNRAQRRRAARMKFTMDEAKQAATDIIMETEEHKNNMIQLASLLVLHREFGFGSQRLYKFFKCMTTTVQDAMCADELRQEVEQELPGLLESGWRDA